MLIVTGFMYPPTHPYIYTHTRARAHTPGRYMHDEARGCDDLKHLDAQNRAHLAHYTANCHTMERLGKLNTNIGLLRKHHAASMACGAGSTLEAEIMGIRVGEFVVVTFPGELSSEIGMALKRASPHPNTFINCYSNGYAYAAALFVPRPALCPLPAGAHSQKRERVCHLCHHCCDHVADGRRVAQCLVIVVFGVPGLKW